MNRLEFLSRKSAKKGGTRRRNYMRKIHRRTAWYPRKRPLGPSLELIPGEGGGQEEKDKFLHAG